MIRAVLSCGDSREKIIDYRRHNNMIGAPQNDRRSDRVLRSRHCEPHTGEALGTILVVRYYPFRLRLR